MSTVDAKLLLFGIGEQRRRLLRSLLFATLACFCAYAIVRGERTFRTFLDLTIELGVSRAGVWLLLEVFVRQAPSLTVVLLGISGLNAYHDGGLLVSCLLSVAVLLGMSFAVFGIPPQLMNVVEPAIPAGLIVGALGWLLGYAVRRIAD